jgi:hypothetical protein
LLTPFPKIFEETIHTRLSKHLKTIIYYVFIDQYGFRGNYSTEKATPAIGSLVGT